MQTLLSRLSLRCAVPQPNMASHHKVNTGRESHSGTDQNGPNFGTSSSSDLALHLPELPETPRYPCPFLTSSDIEKYLIPLYRTGWGISQTPSEPTTTKPRAPATQLSRRIMFPNPDLAGMFITNVTSHITDPENHHPTWGEENNHDGIRDVHIHTHAALSPVGRQNADDQQVFKQRRPGITLRDIRWAILFEGLLEDYIRQGLLENSNSQVVFPQPKDLDSVHNFRALPSQP